MLTIARGIDLPDHTITRKVAILAMSGAGKTHTGAVLCEEMSKHRMQFVVVDPLGHHWGIRAGRNGQKAGGLPVVIFGGKHADVDLTLDNAAAVGEWIVNGSISAILDLKHIRNKRMQIEIVHAVMEYVRYNNSNPIHIMLDEADFFVPQKPTSDVQFACRELIDDLARRGRGDGIGATFITQRPAVIDKNVLTQCDTLIALRMVGLSDRKVVEAWIKANTTGDVLKQVVESLASLETGHAWVWSPLNGILLKRKIRARRTFDSSATPKHGKAKQSPATLKAINLTSLQNEFAGAIERAQDADPKIARAKIDTLQNELEQARKRTEKRDSLIAAYEAREKIQEQQPTIIDVEIPMIHQGTLEHVQEALNEIGAMVEGQASAFVGHLAALQNELIYLHQKADAMRRDLDGAIGQNNATNDERVAAMMIPKPAQLPSNGTTDLNMLAGKMRMLLALARIDQPLDSKHWALAAILPPNRTFATYRSALAKDGMIRDTGDHRWGITGKGTQELKGQGITFDGPPKTDEIIADWKAIRKIGGGVATLLDFIVSAYPQEYTRKDWARQAQLEMGARTISTYVSKLKSNGLVLHSGGKYYKANPFIFEVGKLPIYWGNRTP